MNPKSTATLAKAQQQLKEVLAKHPQSRIEINVRVSAKEKADWTRLAKDLDTTLSALVRTCLNQVAQGNLNRNPDG